MNSTTLGQQSHLGQVAKKTSLFIFILQDINEDQSSDKTLITLCYTQKRRRCCRCRKHRRRRNLEWTNVTPPTNVTALNTLQTLRTANVTRCHNMICARISNAEMLYSHINFSLYAKPEVIAVKIFCSDLVPKT